MKIINNKLNYLSCKDTSILSSERSGFFCSLGWFDNFIKTVTEFDGLDVRFIYSGSDDSDILIPAIFVREGFFRKIKSLSNYYTPIFSIFSKKWPSSFLVDSFFCELKKIKGWDVIDLKPLSIDECRFILSHTVKSRYTGYKYYCFTNWYLNVNGRSYHEYYSSLPSRLRNTLKRKTSKFFANKSARIQILCSEQGLEEGLLAYHTVYESSWKVTEPYPDFMTGLIKFGMSTGMGRLGVAYIDNIPVAAQYWIVSDNCAYIFKLAYDDSYKEYSIGSVLTAKLMEFVIDNDKVNIVDFLTGDDSYKKDWMSHKVDRFGIILFNPTTFWGIVGGVLQKLKDKVLN